MCWFNANVQLQYFFISSGTLQMALLSQHNQNIKANWMVFVDENKNILILVTNARTCWKQTLSNIILDLGFMITECLLTDYGTNPVFLDPIRYEQNLVAVLPLMKCLKAMTQSRSHRHFCWLIDQGCFILAHVYKPSLRATWLRPSRPSGAQAVWPKRRWLNSVSVIE